MLLGSVVLAGGRSRRMGRPKEWLPIGDGTMLGRTVENLLACTFPVVVVARDPVQDLPPIDPECSLVFDEQLDQGPLHGLLSGMRAIAADCDAAFVTGCDSPFVTGSAVDWLSRQLGDDDVAMAEVEGELQPLGAVYRTSLLPQVERLLAEGERSLRALARSCRTRILTEAEIDGFDPSRDFLRNINDPEDYAAILARLEPRRE